MTHILWRFSRSHLCSSVVLKIICVNVGSWFTSFFVQVLLGVICVLVPLQNSVKKKFKLMVQFYFEIKKNGLSQSLFCLCLCLVWCPGFNSVSNLFAFSFSPFFFFSKTRKVLGKAQCRKSYFNHFKFFSLSFLFSTQHLLRRPPGVGLWATWCSSRCWALKEWTIAVPPAAFANTFSAAASSGFGFYPGDNDHAGCFQFTDFRLTFAPQPAKCWDVGQRESGICTGQEKTTTLLADGSGTCSRKPLFPQAS